MLSEQRNFSMGGNVEETSPLMTCKLGRNRLGYGKHGKGGSYLDVLIMYLCLALSPHASISTFQGTVSSPQFTTEQRVMVEGEQLLRSVNSNKTLVSSVPMRSKDAAAADEELRTVKLNAFPVRQ